MKEWLPAQQRTTLVEMEPESNKRQRKDDSLLEKETQKITGFQFAPGGDSRKVLIASADSHVRFFDGFELVGKYKGFHSD